MKKLIILCIGIILLVGFIGINIKEEQLEEVVVNYEGLVLLKLAPNAESRMPTEKDIDTKLRLTDGENNYVMFESRDWNKLDYGKTFLVGIK